MALAVHGECEVDICDRIENLVHAVEIVADVRILACNSAHFVDNVLHLIAAYAALDDIGFELCTVGKCDLFGGRCIFKALYEIGPCFLEFVFAVCACECITEFIYGIGQFLYGIIVQTV